MPAPHLALIAASAAVVLLLSRLAPQYLLNDSVWLTGVVGYFVQYAAYWVYIVVVWPTFLSPLRALPEVPGGTFLLGHFRRILKDPSGHPQRDWARDVPNDGLIRYKSLLNAERVLVVSVKGLAEVLMQKSYDFVKPPQFQQSLGRLLGIGILFAEGDEHKRQRRLLNPAFSFRHVKELYPLFWTKAQEMVKAIDRTISTASPDAEKPSNVIEVANWASRSTLDIIGEAGMSQSFNAIQDPQNHLYQTYQSVFRHSPAARVLGLLTLFLPFWLVRNLPLARNRAITSASDAVRRACRDMVVSKRAQLARGDKAGVDILSVALQSGGFTDDELVNQLMTFLAAGHETTATSMTWALLLLSQHPSVQHRLRAELRAANLPSPSDATATLTAADVDRAPYLSAVCNEILRVCPPVPQTIRVAARPTTLLGTPIPRGTPIIMSIVAINTSEELWGADAASFDPERWMGAGNANSGGADSNYAFLTFLHGPRSCIGQGFARAEFMCLLAAWVLAFETELEVPDLKVEIVGDVTQRPKGGLRVRLTPAPVPVD